MCSYFSHFRSVSSSVGCCGALSVLAFVACKHRLSVVRINLINFVMLKFPTHKVPETDRQNSRKEEALDIRGNRREDVRKRSLFNDL